MIKCGDSTSDPDHGKNRSDSDAYQVMRKDKTNRDCQTDIKKVETIFGKSYAFVDEIGDCLNNSISGIGDDTYPNIQETLSMASSVNIIKLPSETVNETVADGSMYRYLIRYLREPQGV